MTTANQTKWLEALALKIKEIDDPDPDVITNDRYKLTAVTGKCLTITFRPRGADKRIKADIMREADFDLEKTRGSGLHSSLFIVDCQK